MPTNRLILVSKSGFTRGALKRVALENGRVSAIQPNLVMVDNEPVVRNFSMDEVAYDVTGCRIFIRNPDGTKASAIGAPNIDTRQDGTFVAKLSDLVNELVDFEPVKLAIINDARNHPERDSIRGFSCGGPIAELECYVSHVPTSSFWHIEEIVIWGDFSFSQREIDMPLTDLDGRIFGSAEIEVGGHPVAIVGITDAESQTTTVSWHSPRAPIFSASAQPALFPEIERLLRLPTSVEAPVVDAWLAAQEPGQTALKGQGPPPGVDEQD
ncbi:hypothetical protein ACQP2P_01630 [Dactylosporangium sp. CA-139114]|uniref:hypothetical protein n=1 Tax=Dactylosporangium sp. CA-139114 TaxID=3239931 RepID=UPI003D977596